GGVTLADGMECYEESGVGSTAVDGQGTRINDIPDALSLPAGRFSCTAAQVVYQSRESLYGCTRAPSFNSSFYTPGVSNISITAGRSCGFTALAGQRHSFAQQNIGNSGQHPVVARLLPAIASRAP